VIDVAAEPIHAQFEWSSISPSVAVIETVAAAVDRDPTAIKPLYEFIDPDALDTLVLSDESLEAADTVTTSFVFVNQQVTVRGTGEVVVGPVKLDR
jgi:hypothetical protein